MQCGKNIQSITQHMSLLSFSTLHSQHKKITCSSNTKAKIDRYHLHLHCTYIYHSGRQDQGNTKSKLINFNAIYRTCSNNDFLCIKMCQQFQCRLLQNCNLLLSKVCILTCIHYTAVLTNAFRSSAFRGVMNQPNTVRSNQPQFVFENNLFVGFKNASNE